MVIISFTSNLIFTNGLSFLQANSINFMKIMQFLIVFCAILLLYPSPVYTQSPAPAPMQEYVNLADLLSVAGPFHKFLDLLQSKKVIETFQNQANNTDEGITIFVPKDKAFSSLKNPSISNLTETQMKSLLLFHGLPHFYSLAEFKNLSQLGSVNTFAGAGEGFRLKFSDEFGTVKIGSGWTNTKVTSSVHSTDPVAVYQIDNVLLPEAIFGTDIPPAPAPEKVPEADTPAGLDDGSLSHSSCYRNGDLGLWSYLVLGIIGGMFLY